MRHPSRPPDVGRPRVMHAVHLRGNPCGQLQQVGIRVQRADLAWSPTLQVAHPAKGQRSMSLLVADCPAAQGEAKRVFAQREHQWWKRQDAVGPQRVAGERAEQGTCRADQRA